MAGALGLRLGEAKTRIEPVAAGIEYLGIRFDRTFPQRAAAEASAPRSKALYVTRQGAWIGAAGGQIRVRDAGPNELLSVPAEHVGHVVCWGSVAFSAGFRTEALTRDIDVVFLSRRGGYLGRLDSARSHGTELRQEQYRQAGNPEWRLAIARRLVAGKLANQRALLPRRHRRMGTEPCLAAARAIEGRRRASLECQDIPALMGVEGSAAHPYFVALSALLDPAFGFRGRRRRPPPDPVNALLSLGYTPLVRECAGAAAAAGFDPNVGFLHARERARPSLALDLVEEFRAPVVDTAVLEALRGGALGPGDFRYEDGGACRLTDTGLRRFLGLFEQRMLTTFAHVPSGQRLSYRRAPVPPGSAARRVPAELRDDYRPVSWR
jgi:CRISPR-associated protein Cas1